MGFNADAGGVACATRRRDGSGILDGRRLTPAGALPLSPPRRCRILSAMSAPPQTGMPKADPQAELERRHDIGHRLDALISGRAAQSTESGDMAGPAAQVLARWRRVGQEPLSFDGTKARLGEAPVGEVGVDLDGRWWLARNAGLGSLRPEQFATANNLLALTDAIAALRPEDGSIRAFRVALTTGVFSGWAFGLLPPAWRLPTRLGLGLQGRGTIDARRAAGVAQLLALATDSPLDVDVDTADRSDLRAVRTGVDAAAFWLQAEAAFLDGDEGRRALLPPTQHALWLTRAAREGPTLGLGATMSALRRSGGSHGAALDRALQPRALAREVGRRVRLDALALTEIEGLLKAGDAWAGGLASGLLERGRGDERSVQALQGIVARFGLEKLWELASLEGIDEPGARSLALVLREANAAPQIWADLVGVAPARVAAWILSSAPASLLQRFGPPLRRAMRDRGAEESAPLIEALLRTEQREAARVVVDALIESRGVGWAGRLVPETLQAAVHHGLGKPLLLPLFLDREVDVKLRLLVLRALHGDPATLEEAVKFRVTEVMEPRELQDRIKAARKAQKG